MTDDELIERLRADFFDGTLADAVLIVADYTDDPIEHSALHEAGSRLRWAAARLTELTADLKDARHARDGFQAERDMAREDVARLMCEPDDIEMEDALKGEGIFVWGPDGERFLRMFDVVMGLRARAALSACQEGGNG